MALYECVIDKKTAIPTKARGAKGLSYPFDSLEVGQSLFFEGRKTPCNVQSANKALAPKHFVCRIMADGVRVFRDK